MPEFPTEEWFQAYIEAVDASEEYAEYAATGEGAAGIHVEARAASAEFVIRAPYSRWKDVIRGDLEPVKGLVQGKLRVRGDLPKILRYTKGTQELAYIAGQVDTTFPDEP
jgi:putative sterol carrier protein